MVNSVPCCYSIGTFLLLMLWDRMLALGRDLTWLEHGVLLVFAALMCLVLLVHKCEIIDRNQQIKLYKQKTKLLRKAWRCLRELDMRYASQQATPLNDPLLRRFIKTQ